MQLPKEKSKTRIMVSSTQKKIKEKLLLQRERRSGNHRSSERAARAELLTPEEEK